MDTEFERCATCGASGRVEDGTICTDCHGGGIIMASAKSQAQVFIESAQKQAAQILQDAKDQAAIAVKTAQDQAAEILKKAGG